MTDGFVFYASFYQAVSVLPEEERLAAYDMICRYALTGDEPERITGAAYAVYLMAKPQIDKNRQRRENGAKGGRPITKTKPNNNQTITKVEPKVKDKDKVKDKEKETKKEKFVAPTVDDVRAYCAERRNNVDAEAFVAFYDSKGWRVGSQPMKNWKSAIITWEKRRAAEGKNKFCNFPQRTDPENAELMRKVIAIQ